MKGVNGIKGEDGYTRFNVGTFVSLNDAKQKQTELKKNGYADCFITAYHSNKKISLGEAATLLQKK